MHSEVKVADWRSRLLDAETVQSTVGRFGAGKSFEFGAGKSRVREEEMTLCRTELALQLLKSFILS